MTGTFKTFQETSLPLIEEFEVRCAREHPNFIVSSHFEPDVFYLTILIKDAPMEVPDLVDLQIDTRVPPGIVMDVVWGDGDGTVEGNFETPDLSESSLAEVFEKFPEFMEQLLKVALRGGPQKRRL